eukprot:15159072-Ditylum_brightwellii.AAC.1
MASAAGVEVELEFGDRDNFMNDGEDKLVMSDNEDDNDSIPPLLSHNTSLSSDDSSYHDKDKLSDNSTYYSDKENPDAEESNGPEAS